MMAGNAIQLVPDGTLLLHLGIIAVMVSLLNRGVLKPINDILRGREERTRGWFKEAKEMAARIEELARRYERELRAARAEGYARMDQVRRGLSATYEEKLGVFRSEVTAWLAEQNAQLREDAAAAGRQLEIAARTMALRISSQILDREFSEEDLPVRAQT